MRILLCLCCFLFIAAHDTPIAFFKIYNAQEGILLEIIFDTDDLSNELGIKTNEWEASLLQNYIEKHTRFEFDSCPSKALLKKFQQRNGHTELLLLFDDVSDYSSSILIENNCLLSITNHSNVIEIGKGTTARSFRMHKGRTKIKIDL